MRKAAPKVEEQKRAGGHYKEALEVIAALRRRDNFFDQVMVMAENELSGKPARAAK